MEVDQRKCQHVACTCRVPLHESYCSDACAVDAVEATHSASCQCAHADCESTAKPALAEG